MADYLFFDDEHVEAIHTDLELELNEGQIRKFGTGWISRRPDRFSISPLDSRFIFGRENGASPLVSRTHFSLVQKTDGLFLSDHSSNGTFLNGRRVNREQPVRVQTFDRIFAGGFEFIVLDSWLLCPWKAGNEIRRLGRRIPRKEGTFQVPELIWPKTIRLESPPVFSPEQSMAVPSPAGMIAISSLASVLSSWLVSGMDPRSAISSLTGAGISALAFSGWYRYSGLRQKKNRQAENEKLKNGYLAYIDQQLEHVQNEYEKKRQILMETQMNLAACTEETLGCFRRTEQGFPIAIQWEDSPDFEQPSISWQHQDSVCAKALEQISAHTSQKYHWVFLKDKDHLKLTYSQSSSIIRFIELWCWMVKTDQRRLALLNLSLPETLPKTNAFDLDGKSLIFEEERELLEWIDRFPRVEFTVLTGQPLDVVRENLTVIELMTNQSGLPELWMNSNHPKQNSLREADYPQTAVANRKRLQTILMEQFKKRYEHQANLRVELDDGVFWDLKKEGPHALIAGATGSGKSEGLTLVLYQLAVQNRPDQCSWILIDFKGGAFAKPLEKLPHTVGMVSNLDERAIDRLERALDLELNRRQKAALDDQSNEPRSHLLICVDEFGQLKARYPEFMKKLQETARIGRSLGVHLILSTQKPAGLVDEQIWANAQSRLCFPVLDRADSMEVLGHEGAWKMKTPGSFILQSSQGEKSGRAFYMKTPAQGSRLEWKDEQSTWYLLDCETLEDRLASRLACKKTRKWILAPDPKACSDSFDGIVMDGYSEIHSWIPKAGEPVLALMDKTNQKQFLNGLIHQSHQLLVSNFDCPQARKLSTLQFWRMIQDLEHRPSKGTVNPPTIIWKLQENESSELLNRLLSLPSVCLVIVTDSLSYTHQKLISLCPVRLAGGIENREQIALCFEGKLTAVESWPVLNTLDHGQSRRLVCSTAPTTQKPNQDQRQKEMWNEKCMATAEELRKANRPLLIGVEERTGKPLDWRRKLIVLFDDEAGRQAAQGLVRRFDLLRSGFHASGALLLVNARMQRVLATELSGWMEQADVLFLNGVQKRWPEVFGSSLYETLQVKAWLVREREGIGLRLAGIQDSSSWRKEGEGCRVFKTDFSS